MTLRELLKGSDFHSIWGVLQSDFAHGAGDKGRFFRLHAELLARFAQKSRNVARSMGFDQPQFIIVAKLLDDAPPESYDWNFLGYGVQSDTIYGYSLIPWDEWLDMQICQKSLSDFGPSVVLAIVLEEMLMGFGFYDGELGAVVTPPDEQHDAGDAYDQAPLLPAQGREASVFSDDGDWDDSLIKIRSLQSDACSREPLRREDAGEMFDPIDFEYMDLADQLNDRTLAAYKLACKEQLSALRGSGESAGV